jgi:hypothetical protein
MTRCKVRNVRVTIVTITPLFWLVWVAPLAVLILLSTAAAQAQGDRTDLSGTVVGKDHKPKPGVSVDILGPTKISTETDGSGRFRVRVRPGAYVIRVREGERRMEFSQQVRQGKNDERFQLAW